jgi:hypothetical protein
VEKPQVVATEFQQIINALSTLRIGKISVEYDLQDKIAAALGIAGIKFKKEYRLGPRNRVNFLAAAGTAIEIIKDKPNRLKLIEQAERYTVFPQVRAIILVVETSICVPLPPEINNKLCVVFGLQKLWGIAL